MEMTTAFDTQIDEDIDLLVCRQNNQPPPKALWPIATENQTLANTFGWEKIAKGWTHDFPDQKATVRVARNNGKPDVVYGIYFVFAKRSHPTGWTNWMQRLVVSVYGEINERAFSCNGTIPADKETFRMIMDTTLHIESEFQRVFGYKQKLSVP